MARTYRRGRPNRNIQQYVRRGVFYGEGECYNSYTGELYPCWVNTYGKDDSYEQYQAKAVREYHQDKQKHGASRYARLADVKRQARHHLLALHRASRSGDWDVVLETLVKQVLWMSS